MVSIPATAEHGNFRRLSSARGTEIASNRAGASTCCRAATHLAQDGEAQVRQEGGEKGAATGDGQLRLHVLPSHRLHPHHHVSLPAPREPAPRARRRLLACAQGTLCAAAPARHDWPLRRSVLPVPCVGMPARFPRRLLTSPRAGRSNKKARIGTVRCSQCNVDWSTTTSALSEPIDVFCEWVDAAEEANADPVPAPRGGGASRVYSVLFFWPLASRHAPIFFRCSRRVHTLSRAPDQRALPIQVRVSFHVGVLCGVLSH